MVLLLLAAVVTEFLWESWYNFRGFYSLIWLEEETGLSRSQLVRRYASRRHACGWFELSREELESLSQSGVRGSAEGLGTWLELVLEWLFYGSLSVFLVSGLSWLFWGPLFLWPMALSSLILLGFLCQGYEDNGDIDIPEDVSVEDLSFDDLERLFGEAESELRGHERELALDIRADFASPLIRGGFWGLMFLVGAWYRAQLWWERRRCQSVKRELRECLCELQWQDIELRFSDMEAGEKAVLRAELQYYERELSRSLGIQD